MSPLEQEVVRRKLERIATNVRLLEPISRLDIEAYRADPYRLKATERLLQEIVEAAVDINAHVLVQSGRPAPDDLYSSFLGVGSLGMLPSELAHRLAPSAGLRNRLVHEYDLLDDTLVLASVREAVTQYAEYVAAVQRFLEG